MRTTITGTLAGSAASARDAAHDVVLGAMVRFTVIDDAMAHVALGSVTALAKTIAVARVDGVLAAEGLITLVAAETFRMIDTTFRRELTAVDRAATSITGRGRAREALDLAVDQFVLQTVDGIVAGRATEAFVVEATVIRGDVRAVLRESTGARSARVGTDGAVLADVSGGLRLRVSSIIGGLRLRVRGVALAGGATASSAHVVNALRHLADESFELRVELVRALRLGHVSLDAGRGVHMVVEQFLFVIGHSRINTHDEILLII